MLLWNVGLLRAWFCKVSNVWKKFEQGSLAWISVEWDSKGVSTWLSNYSQNTGNCNYSFFEQTWPRKRTDARIDTIEYFQTLLDMKYDQLDPICSCNKSDTHSFLVDVHLQPAVTILAPADNLHNHVSTEIESIYSWCCCTACIQVCICIRLWIDGFEVDPTPREIGMAWESWMD